jgi:hypothetical protein
VLPKCPIIRSLAVQFQSKARLKAKTGKLQPQIFFKKGLIGSDVTIQYNHRGTQITPDENYSRLLFAKAKDPVA